MVAASLVHLLNNQFEECIIETSCLLNLKINSLIYVISYPIHITNRMSRLICQQGIWSQSAKKIHFTHVIGTKRVNVYKSAKYTTKFMSLERLNTHRIV